MILDSELPTPSSLLKKFQLTDSDSLFISNSRETAKQIVSGKSSKLALIVGPCSIHNIKSALLYAQKLQKLSLYVKETLFLLMRVYVEKPRTTTGWKGLLYDPFLNGTDDLSQGLSIVRELFLELAKLRLPTATEFVNPLSSIFFKDLVTWGFIGARTTTSQVHRELASSLPFPIGFKNTLEGNLSYPINSMIAAKTSHTFLTINEHGTLSQSSSNGNPYCHLVLRGSDIETNFDKESIQYAKDLQKKSGIYHPIMVDCAHGNSGKNHHRQKHAFHTITDQYIESETPIQGIMLESFLDEGNQPFELGCSLSPTTSITDPCLNWEDTEQLILSFHERIQSQKLCVHMKT